MATKPPPSEIPELRTFVAALAMLGLLSRGYTLPLVIAEDSIKFADALLAALDE
jgi:hypothetical protein